MHAFIKITTILLVLIFSACEELPDFSDNIFETPLEDQIPQITSLPDPLINGSSVIFNWEGNEFALEFSYKLTSSSYETQFYSEWSDWNNEPSFSIDNLDEGNYTFHVKSRFDLIEQDEATTINFKIDAITGPALRIYPMQQEVQRGDDFYIYIVAEEFPDLMLMTVDLQFDTNVLEVIGISAGDTFTDNSDFMVMLSTDGNREGSLSVTAGLLSQQNLDEAIGVSTALLAKVTLRSSESGQHSITILASSVFRNTNYEDIGINTAVEGNVEVID